MKLKEVYKEIINQYCNKKPIYAEKFENKIYVSDSFVVWIIKEEDFIFNISKLNKANIKAIVDSVQNKDLLEGIKTGEYHKDKSLTLAIIKNEEIKVQVNEKYLKYFNESCSFKIVNDTTPVLVYEGEELIGLICPVKNY